MSLRSPSRREGQLRTGTWLPRRRSSPLRCWPTRLARKSTSLLSDSSSITLSRCRRSMRRRRGGRKRRRRRRRRGRRWKIPSRLPGHSPPRRVAPRRRKRRRGGGKRKRGGRKSPLKLPPLLAVGYDYLGGVMSSTACRVVVDSALLTVLTVLFGTALCRLLEYFFHYFQYQELFGVSAC